MAIKKAKKPASKAAKLKSTIKKAVPARKTATKASAPKKSGGRGEDSYTTYSGKFTVRLPRSLHKDLVDRAEKEGVSLNLFVTNALSKTVGVPGRRK